MGQIEQFYWRGGFHRKSVQYSDPLTSNETDSLEEDGKHPSNAAEEQDHELFEKARTGRIFR